MIGLKYRRRGTKKEDLITWYHEATVYAVCNVTYEERNSEVRPASQELLDNFSFMVKSLEIPAHKWGWKEQ